MLSRQLVLVAIDRATDMKRAIDVAHTIAKTRGADIEVLEVVSGQAAHVDDDRVSMGARLASILRSGDPDGVHVRSVTLSGTPEHVIPAYSQLHQAALLVVQHDYGSSRWWPSGRVVDDLARHSPIPLLVLPRRKTPERDEPGLRRILIPVDDSTASAVALRTAVDLSHRHGARVGLVHAIRDVLPHMVFSGSEARAVVRQLPAQLDAVAESLRRRAAYFGANDVDTEVATGDAGRAILEVAARWAPDVIVMGVAQRTWLDRVVFGSTLRRVLRRATVPVLVIPVVAGAHAWPNEHSGGQLNRGMWAESAVDRVA